VKVKLTKADCEYLCFAWKDQRYEEVINELEKLNYLEIMKFSRHIIMFHDETGEIEASYYYECNCE